MSKVADPRAVRLLAIRKVLSGMVTQMEGLRNIADSNDDFMLKDGTDAGIAFGAEIAGAMIAVADAQFQLNKALSETFIWPHDGKNQL